MSKKKILVVEDHPGSRMLLVDVLTFANYDVYEAGDGLEGIDMAKQHKPDLILSDMGMPRLSGWEMVPKLKEDPELKHIPVVAITAFAMTGDREKAIELGCAGYISKPIEIRQIRQQVKDFLPKPQESSAAKTA